jgi:hypothetical protein
MVATLSDCFKIDSAQFYRTHLGRDAGMKSFWIGSIAAVVIAIVAGTVLTGTEMTSGQKFSTSSTRL